VLYFGSTKQCCIWLADLLFLTAGIERVGDHRFRGMYRSRVTVRLFKLSSLQYTACTVCLLTQLHVQIHVLGDKKKKKLNSSTHA